MKKVLLGKRILDPDVLLRSDGISCGDVVILSLSKLEDRIILNFKGECCSVCEKACEYLVNQYSNSWILHVKATIAAASFIDEVCKVLNVQESRKGCVSTPINLLLNGLRLIDYKQERVIPIVPLACDACVESIGIQWHAKEPKKKRTSIKKVIEQINDYEDNDYEKLQRLSKCVLSANEKNCLERLMTTINEKTIKDAKKLRLPVLFYNNLESNPVENELIHLARRQIVSNHIALTEIEIVNSHIKNHQWGIAAVKGARTSEFYPEGSERTHLDFDYVANNLEDGFKLISYLINDRSFKFVSGGSVPFSMKVIQNMDKKEILNGHLHLEKILQDQYQVVIDINLGGFPLSRSSIISVNHNRHISVEEQIVITLCHIFKHEKVYMKDLNDIYYMLKSETLDYDYLHRLLKLNQLDFLMTIVIHTLKVEYHFFDKRLNVKNPILGNIVKDVVCKKWPYSIKSHFYAKAYDLLQRNIKLYGLSIGVHETHKQLTDHKEKILEVSHYNALTKTLNQRVYLSPLVLFNKIIVLNSSDMDIVQEGVMYRYRNLIVTTFGIFLRNTENHVFNKTKVTSDLEIIIAQLGLKDKDFKEDYIMNARTDLWLY